MYMYEMTLCIVYISISLLISTRCYVNMGEIKTDFVKTCLVLLIEENEESLFLDNLIFVFLMMLKEDNLCRMDWF